MPISSETVGFEVPLGERGFPYLAAGVSV